MHASMRPQRVLPRNIFCTAGTLAQCRPQPQGQPRVMKPKHAFKSLTHARMHATTCVNVSPPSPLSIESPKSCHSSSIAPVPRAWYQAHFLTCTRQRSQILCVLLRMCAAHLNFLSVRTHAHFHICFQTCINLRFRMHTRELCMCAKRLQEFRQLTCGRLQE